MRYVISQRLFDSRRLLRGSATIGIIAAALVISTTVALAYGHRSQSDVYTFDEEPELVDGASAQLIRTPNGVSMKITTVDLDPGAAYTVWWVVFNHPENCVHPVGDLTGCGEDDLFIDEVGGAVLYATGNVVGKNGRAGFGGNLKVGDLSGCQEPFDSFGICGDGLVDPSGAEVHLVVRSHGEVIPAMMPAMIHTFAGGCTPESSFGAGAGPNECVDKQFAVFVP